MGELQKIPGIGKTGEQDLIKLGYPTIESLRGAVYYANTPEQERDAEKLKCWNWKD